MTFVAKAKEPKKTRKKSTVIKNHLFMFRLSLRFESFVIYFHLFIWLAKLDSRSLRYFFAAARYFVVHFLFSLLHDNSMRSCGLSMGTWLCNQLEGFLRGGCCAFVTSIQLKTCNLPWNLSVRGFIYATGIFSFRLMSSDKLALMLCFLKLCSAKV